MKSNQSHVLSLRLLLVWLPFLLCHICIVPAQQRTAASTRHYNADAIDCQNISEIVFLGFFPCLRQNSGSDFEASRNIKECDLLAEAAAQLAVERVNADPDVLHPNVTLTLYPIYIPSGGNSLTLHDQYETVLQMFQLLYEPEYSNRIWGVIGPSDNPGVANFVAPISANSGLLTVSYGARTTSSKTENIPTFYRTLPASDTMNFGRLVLLANHNWLRIAILKSTAEEYYSEESSHFISIFDQYINSDIFGQISLDRTETFSHSPVTALRSIKARDINIIFGFFGPENARTVLCEAESMGLISADHAWVLPSYYDPDWWKSPPNSTAECSDEKMREILESVIFIDNIKIPPVDLSLDDFHDQLLSKALELVNASSLTEEDLKPYLLHSRATNAYDAVTLLARSVGVAFDQDGDSCTDTSLIQVAFQNVFMQCEYCRLFTALLECFTYELDDPDEEFFTNSTKYCDACRNVSNNIANSSRFNLEDLYLAELLQNNYLTWPLQNLYGQISYSQFLSGEECPITLWWPVLSDEEFNKSYLLINDFDNTESSTSCVAQHLNLSRRSFVNKRSNCSTHFYWRGSYAPPSSHFLEVSSISIGELVFIGIIVLIGMVFATVLLIFNIVWRKNKNVKASSPWMNIILLIGILLRLPTSVYGGIIFSGYKYPGLTGMDFTPLCYCAYWQYYIGDILFVATLIAKNWRIYKIFFNKGLKERGYQLSDKVLVISVLLLMLPVVIVLIIWTIFGIHYTSFPLQNENLQIVVITVCATEPPLVFESVLNAFVFVLFLFLFILSLLTASVPSSLFRREGLATYKAVVLIILPTPALFLGRLAIFLSSNGFQYQALLWLDFCWISVLPIILMLVLFAPIVLAVVRGHLEERHTIAEEKEMRKVSSQYDFLKRRADTLRSQLEQTNRTIRRIKTDLALDTGKALVQLQMNSTGAGQRFSWHGTTDTVLKEVEFSIVHEEGGGKRERHKRLTRAAQDSGGVTANKVASMSNILLTKSSFFDRTSSSEQV